MATMTPNRPRQRTRRKRHAALRERSVDIRGEPPNHALHLTAAGEILLQLREGSASTLAFPGRDRLGDRAANGLRT